MLSATSRIALLSIARSTRPWTPIPAHRGIRARRRTTAATTAHAYDTLPLSDAQRKTIYALSTPSGKSGIAVIRVSGPEALSVWQRMVRSARPGRDKGTNTTARLPEPWKLERCHVLDPHTSEVLDEALAVFFRGAPPIAKLPSSADERAVSTPLVHHRGCAGVTRAWRARGRRRGSCCPCARPWVPSCRRRRVHASRVRGW
jgi:hypothetical protein